MDNLAKSRLVRLTAIILTTAIVFFLFFQVNKSDPIGAINPFGVDPFDAVGSIAVQVALFVSLLTFARGLRLKEDPSQSIKLRLVIRGCSLTLLAILVTLVADAIAVIAHPLQSSVWGGILLGELVLMYVLILAVTVDVWIFFRSLRAEPPPADVTLADSIDDLWALVRFPLKWIHNFLPSSLVDWLLRLNSDRIFSRFPWIYPRLHPWRFSAGLAGLIGLALPLAELVVEGPPPNILIGLLVFSIFIGVELIAVLGGLLLFGGYLGLRPLIRNKL